MFDAWLGYMVGERELPSARPRGPKIVAEMNR
jgi:hypothetical protein